MAVNQENDCIVAEFLESHVSEADYDALGSVCIAGHWVRYVQCLVDPRYNVMSIRINKSKGYLLRTDLYRSEPESNHSVETSMGDWNRSSIDGIDTYAYGG